MKSAKTSFPVVAALLIAVATALVACGKDHTAGTDEQANSITALDSALAEWTANDTLVAPETQSDTCTTCMSFNILLPKPGIEVKNGTLYNVFRKDFESVSCETETTWFLYSVRAGDSLIRKALALPDSLNADGFELDCASEGGVFGTDSTDTTKVKLTHTCDLETAANLTDEKNRLYIDPNWKKYVELIVGICRD